MDSQNKRIASEPIGRITSVDFFRGITMFLLIGESTGIYDHFSTIHNSAFFQFLGNQLHHHEWNGLHFWDLIQPFFMFIVGVAIPFAASNRIKKGDTNKLITYHAVKRSFLLLFLGWALYCIEPGQIGFRFQNVLAQLSLTYLFAFLIRNKSFSFQLLTTVGILLMVDLAYRLFPIEGFNQAWVPFHNLGAWVNNKIEGVDKASIWASLNAIPTIAHTVWGVLCGKLIMSDRPSRKKIQLMLIAGITGLVIGYSLDFFSITPIIKKIATSSFVFASGGWAVLALCLCYWLIDVKKYFSGGSKFFIVVGMNCIFIYLLFSLGGAVLAGKIFYPFTRALFYSAGYITTGIITSLAAWASLWYLCYWLYKNHIFIKI